ncbi:hypothetical protein [Oculatella sp. LEGE 06141]|nr:hypothetical protein [Oculatella sp. LEGE 06141]
MAQSTPLNPLHPYHYRRLSEAEAEAEAEARDESNISAAVVSQG